MGNVNDTKMKIYNAELYNYLHNVENLSTAEIAELLNMKKNSIITTLRNHHWLKPSLGRATEEKVAQWLETQGHSVLRQRGDAPFDLLVDGFLRVDVKSATQSYDKYNDAYCYTFELKHDLNIYGDYQRDIDKFYLVFLTEDKMPIFSLDTDQISIKKLKIFSSLKTKYPLKFIGYLES